MRKILGLFFVLSFVGQKVKAQNDILAIAEVNYNTFSHKSLLSFQDELIADIEEVKLKVNDDFGPNIGYSFGIKLEELDTQFFFSYNSTGGKISYSDLSGVIRITQLLKAFSIGGEYQIKMSNEESKHTFYFGVRGFINYSDLNLENFSKIYDSVSTDSVGFNSIDLGLGVRFIYDIPIWVVKLRLNVGYDLLLGGNLMFKENSDFLLEDNQGDNVKTGWNGFRSGIGIVVPF